MKKMIIATLVAISAAFANAAALDWGVSSASADQVGYTVYLVTAIDSEWTGAADVAAAAAALGSGTSGTIAKNGRSYGVASHTADGVNITADSMKNAYLVIVTSADATSYNYYASDFSGSVFTPPEVGPSAVDVTAATLLAGTKGTFKGGPTPGPTPVDTPEPTSGLLLLVGGAALALRRKQK